MSKRRKIGDVVYVRAGAGFGAHDASIQWAVADTPENTDDDLFPCVLDCGDDVCVEWPTLWQARPIGRAVKFHVSECEMFDSQAEAEAA